MLGEVAPALAVGPHVLELAFPVPVGHGPLLDVREGAVGGFAEFRSSRGPVDLLEKLDNANGQKSVGRSLGTGNGVLLQPPGAVLSLKPNIRLSYPRCGGEVGRFAAEGVELEEGSAGISRIDKHYRVLLAAETAVFAALCGVSAREVRERTPFRHGFGDEIVRGLSGRRDKSVRLPALRKSPRVGDKRAHFGGEHLRRIAVERIRRIGASVFGKVAHLRPGEEPVVGHRARERERTCWRRIGALTCKGAFLPEGPAPGFCEGASVGVLRYAAHRNVAYGQGLPDFAESDARRIGAEDRNLVVVVSHLVPISRRSPHFGEGERRGEHEPLRVAVPELSVRSHAPLSGDGARRRGHDRNRNRHLHVVHRLYARLYLTNMTKPQWVTRAFRPSASANTCTLRLVVAKSPATV